MKRIFLKRSKKQIQKAGTPDVAPGLSNEAMSIEDKVKAYLADFLQSKELKIRQCVYISRDTQETISNIVRMVGQRGLTIGAYIDTVLQRHIQEHKDEINELYYKNLDKVIP